VPASHGVRRLLPPVGARWGKLEAHTPNLNLVAMPTPVSKSHEPPLIRDGIARLGKLLRDALVLKHIGGGG
jgi:hypothetical protein